MQDIDAFLDIFRGTYEMEQPLYTLFAIPIYI